VISLSSSAASFPHDAWGSQLLGGFEQEVFALFATIYPPTSAMSKKRRFQRIRSLKSHHLLLFLYLVLRHLNGSAPQESIVHGRSVHQHLSFSDSKMSRGRKNAAGASRTRALCRVMLQFPCKDLYVPFAMPLDAEHNESATLCINKICA
jgi:hypothetical protein